MRIGQTAAGLLAAMLVSAPALGVECPLIEGGNPALAGIDGSVRLNFVQTRLAVDQHHARLWRGGWLIGFSVAMAGQLAVAPAFAYEDRWSLYVGAAKTAVGIGSILLDPLHARDSSDALTTWIAQHPGDDVCGAVREAERLLVRSARDEAIGSGLLLQAGGWALNLAGGLVLGFVFHQWLQAGLSLVEGLVVGEAFFLTRANGAQDALEQYRAGNLEPDSRVHVHFAGNSFVMTF